MNNIYFTVIVNNRGFTDQLSQFSVYYTLGRYLGYRYLHTELKIQRSSPAYYNRYVFISKLLNLFYIIKRFFNLHINLFDLLGINDHFKNTISKKDKFEKIVEIRFDEDFINKNSINSCKTLENYIRGVVENNISETKILVKFIHKFGMDQVWWIKKALPPASEYINIPEIYQQTRTKYPVKSLFNNKKEIKILVHIRQGDVGIVETPWKTYIPILRKRSAALVEYESINEIGKKYIHMFHPSEFLSYIRAFCEHLPQSNYSMLIFSDGYCRSMDMIVRNIYKLNLDKNKNNLLLNAFENFDRDQFKDFESLENTKCVIGESETKLEQLVHSATEADIIICSDQQYMMHKLTTAICSKQKPKVIVLTKNSDSFTDSFFSGEERFTYVNLGSPEYEKTWEKLDLHN